ncbi:MAG: IclR family transcriptional regulator, pca regulon regulatory protein [Solirubrobacteraceae bacterium]
MTSKQPSTDKEALPEPPTLDGEELPEGVDPRYYVQAAGRTVKLLMAMASQPGPVSLQQLVGLVGPNKAVVYRLLRTLEAHGAVRRLTSGGYVLGATLMSVANSARHSAEVARIARPNLEELTKRAGEDSTLAILHWDQIVVLERVIAYQHYLGLRSSVGSRMPAYCTSMGQVLLAGLSDDEVRRRLEDEPLAPAGPNALVTVDDVVERLRQVRRRGYAINDQQLVAGHRSVGAPIRDYRGEVVAAINVSVPSARATLDDMRDKFVPALLQSAAAISAELGWVGDDDGGPS